MEYHVKEGMKLLGIGLFIMFIAWDIWKALRRRAPWIPGNALVLTGLTVQLIGYLDTQNVSTSPHPKENEVELLMRNQQSIDGARVTLCVFIGYLLPGMASATYGGLWSNILALLLSLSTHIATEFYVLRQGKNGRLVRGKQGHWFIASNSILLDSNIYLLLLLCFAVLSGKAIRDSLRSRVLSVLSKNNNNVEDEGRQWETYKIEILKSWIVALICQPEYVLARSLFSIAAGCLVLNSVTAYTTKAIYMSSLLDGGIALISLQRIFILIGCIVIFYRVGMAMYCHRLSYMGRLPTDSVKIYSLPDLVKGYSQLKNLLLVIILGLLNRVLPTKSQWTRAFAVCLVKLPAYFIALNLVFIGSLSWYMSLSISILNRLFNKPELEFESGDEEFLQYKPYLKPLLMPGEEAGILWRTNRNSFRRTKNQIDDAYNRGQSCRELITVLGSNVAENRGRYVSGVESVKSVEEYFPNVKEPMWRMTALSLLEIILEVGASSSVADVDDSSVEQAMKAYEQAQYLMDFVDCPDNVDVNVQLFSACNIEGYLISLAAEKKMETITKLYRLWKMRPSSQMAAHTMTVEAAVKSIREKSEAGGKELEEMHLLGDIQEAKAANALYTDWKTAAPSYCMYKVCKLILAHEHTNAKELMDDLLNFFRDVVVCCLSGLPGLMLKSCRQWASELKDQKILEAIDIGGETFGVLDAATKWKEQNRESATSNTPPTNASPANTFIVNLS